MRRHETKMLMLKKDIESALMLLFKPKALKRSAIEKQAEKENFLKEKKKHRDITRLCKGLRFISFNVLSCS